MDYTIAPNVTAIGAGDTAPATGTKGEFTSGNATTNTPATVLPGYQMNALVEENINVIVAAGLTPSSTNNAQLLQAVKGLAGVVGSMRNAKMSIPSASASATFTADEIVLETALGGWPFRLANFNQSINLATTGAGGMDVGAAPVSGYVALYAIYNPTSGAAALLATNATSTKASSVYAGGAMPAGYTASALVSVWPTTSTGLFSAGYQHDRTILVQNITALTTSAAVGSLTSLSITSCIPLNAIAASGYVNITTASSTSVGAQIAAAANGLGVQLVQLGGVAGDVAQIVGNFRTGIITPQTIFYTFLNTGGSASSLNIQISSYDF